MFGVIYIFLQFVNVALLSLHFEVVLVLKLLFKFFFLLLQLFSTHLTNLSDFFLKWGYLILEEDDVKLGPLSAVNNGLKIDLARLISLLVRLQLFPFFEIFDLFLLNTQIDSLPISFILNLSYLSLELIILSLELFDNIHQYLSTFVTLFRMQSVKIFRNLHHLQRFRLLNWRN